MQKQKLKKLTNDKIIEKDMQRKAREEEIRRKFEEEAKGKLLDRDVKKVIEMLDNNIE